VGILGFIFYTSNSSYKFPRTNTPLMGEKRKKLRIGKNIPLLSTNQKAAFIYKVELYTRKGKFVEREENAV
jgi:hypothetical protein